MMDGLVSKPISRFYCEEALRHGKVMDGHFPLAIILLDLDRVEIVQDDEEGFVVKPKKEDEPCGVPA